MTGPDTPAPPTSMPEAVTTTTAARTAASISRHRSACELSRLLNRELPATLVGVSWRAREGRFEIRADVAGPLLRDVANRCAVRLGLDPEGDLLALGDHEILEGPMALAVTEDRMSAHTTPHWAVPCDRSDQYGMWGVSWLLGRSLGRNQAITAMTIAETVATVHLEGTRRPIDFSHRMLSYVVSWAAELGLTGADALMRASEPPRDLMVPDAAEPRGAR